MPILFHLFFPVLVSERVFSTELRKGLTEKYQKDLSRIIIFNSENMLLDLFSDKMFLNMLHTQVINYEYQHIYPRI